MKKQTAFALLLLMSLSLTLPAQVNRCSYVIPRQTDNWLFHANSGIRFDENGVFVNNPPIPNLGIGTRTSVFSDNNGDLLVYTDGALVYNKNHERINFGEALNSHAISPSIIIPRPLSENYLYIFTIGYTEMLSPLGFFYSSVDLSLGGGVGSVYERNRQLLPQAAAMLSAVENREKDGFWVVTRGLEDRTFYSFKITSSGINTNPVESRNIGTEISSNVIGEIYPQLIGALKFSPKGDRLAMCSTGGNFIELFDFDNETGLVSNPISLSIPPSHLLPGQMVVPNSLEFSKDGTKLYVNFYSFINVIADSRIYQYDLLNGLQYTLINDTPLAQNLNSMQLARDGKIYITRQGSSSLAMIGSPDRPGISCNFVESAVDLGIFTVSELRRRTGLPGFVQSYFDNPHFDYDTKCDGDITEFWLHNPTFSDATTTWDFGDAGNTTPGTGLRPTHQFSGPGVYNVTVTERWNGEAFTTTLPVIINALPPKAFASRGDSLYLFPGSRIPLDGGEGMFAYLWQDGSTGRYFDVNTDGLVVVEYEDMNCCRDSDSLKIISLAISLPNAFSPNGDNLNDYFKPLGPSDGIEDFTLTIHDRWGMKVWETTNFSDKWDGTYAGQKLPNGVYAWYLTFNVIGNVSEIGKVKYKGSVTIVR